MIINFNGDISKQEVQEMIDAAVDFTTGVLNLSYATSGQVQEALAVPNRWLFSIDYSGETYLEQSRIESGASYIVTFYVNVCGIGYNGYRFNDGILLATVDVETGLISTAISDDYAPNIIYNLYQMTSTQLLRFGNRLLGNVYFNPYKECFDAVWYLAGHFYKYGGVIKYAEGVQFYGTCLNGTVVYYDIVSISRGGGLSHTEYTSNIQLTPVQ